MKFLLALLHISLSLVYICYKWKFIILKLFTLCGVTNYFTFVPSKVLKIRGIIVIHAYDMH